MTTYENNGKSYQVESLAYGGLIINVNGTSISELGNGYYSVFVEGEEIVFENFEKAYQFAINEQENTIRKA